MLDKVGKAIYVQKLIDILKPKGIKYMGADELGNAVFKMGEKEKRIRAAEFWRESGICCYKVDVGDHGFKMMTMDDEMFYTSFLKTVLLYVFFPPPKPKQ